MPRLLGDMRGGRRWGPTCDGPSASALEWLGRRRHAMLWAPKGNALVLGMGRCSASDWRCRGHCRMNLSCLVACAAGPQPGGGWCFGRSSGCFCQFRAQRLQMVHLELCRAPLSCGMAGRSTKGWWTVFGPSTSVTSLTLLSCRCLRLRRGCHHAHIDRPTVGRRRTQTLCQNLPHVCGA